MAYNICPLSFSHTPPFLHSFPLFVPPTPFIPSYFHSDLLLYTNFLLTEIFPSRRKGKTHETEKVNPLHLFWNVKIKKIPKDSFPWLQKHSALVEEILASQT